MIKWAGVSGRPVFGPIRLSPQTPSGNGLEASKGVAGWAQPTWVAPHAPFSRRLGFWGVGWLAPHPSAYIKSPQPPLSFIPWPLVASLLLLSLSLSIYLLQ